MNCEKKVMFFAAAIFFTFLIDPPFLGRIGGPENMPVAMDAVGNEISGRYFRQIPVGPFITRTAHGVLLKVSVFDQGQIQGSEFSWYENGKMRTLFNFENGLRQGRSQEWYPDGTPFRDVIFKAGVEVSQKSWREDGLLYSNYAYRNGRYYGLKGGKLCEPSPSIAKASE